MRRLGFRDGVKAAAEADTLSLYAFEVGRFGWIALIAFGYPDPDLHPTSPVYSCLMKIAMIIGFATAWPANASLIKRGIKDSHVNDPRTHTSAV